MLQDVLNYDGIRLRRFRIVESGLLVGEKKFCDFTCVNHFP